jgi:hypothetical protein
MTISAQCLDPAEANKLNDLVQAAKNGTEQQQKDMADTLSGIVQAAIDGAGQAEAQNIKSRIALALRQTFNL